MTTPSSTLITVVQFCNHWCAVRVDPPSRVSFLTGALTQKTTAVSAAILFAEVNNLPYQENALTFDKPIVTIWRALGRWVPAKIFEKEIQGAGITVEDKSKAIEMAKKIAEQEGLDCFPCIGESIFDPRVDHLRI